MRLLVLLMGCSLIYDGSDLHGKNASRPKWKPTTFPGGNAITSIAVGDLDGDGRPEIVAVNNADDNLSVWVNNGGGEFSPDATVPSCVGPVAATIGRFDGRPGVVVVCSDENQTPAVLDWRLLSGYQGGAFASMRTIAAGGEGPRALRAGDFDRDGNLDLAAAFEVSSGVLVLYGDGAGAFPRNRIEPVADRPQDLVVSDLDGDGAPDIAVPSYDGVAVTVLKSGMGPGPRYPLAAGGYGITAGDFDGKLGPDLAVTDYGLPSVELLFATGGGNFPASLPAPVDLRPLSLTRLRAADLDGDGKLDLVVGAYTDPLLLVLYGKGDGMFEEPLRVDAKPASDLEVVDLDGDHKPDIVFASYATPGSVTILLNR